jgi:hypothetical protein
VRAAGKAIVYRMKRGRRGEQDASTDAASAGHRYYVLGVLVAVYAVNFLDRYVLIILLDPIKATLGASDTAMGFLTGLAFALFYTIAGIPIARRTHSPT